jgi:spermidine synthase
MEWTFFEIDPAIVETADARFSYLRNCAPGARILLGDGRLLLAKQPDAAFDLTIIDAFSSDAVPLHLLTREAIALYLSKLAPDGVLMIHISNRFMRLAPVVADLIEDAGLEGRVQSYFPTASEQKQYLFPSVWVAIARDAQTLASLTEEKGWRAARGSGTGRVWTDDYANVAGAVIWTQPDRNR